MRPVGMVRPPLFAAAAAAELLRLERNQRRPFADVRAEQLVRLRDALEAARRSPFWADHLRDVGLPSEVDDIAMWPTVDKATLRAVAEDDRLTAPPPRRTRTLRTSGTTGEPFRVRYAPGGAWWQGVLWLRALRAREIPLVHRRTRLVLFPEEQPASAGIAAAIRSLQELTLPVRAPRDELARRLRVRRPSVVSGFPHLVAELGDLLGGAYRPRAVTTHGETLTDETRAELRRQYGVEPLDAFGTAECGAIAWQCAAADLYHVNHEAVVVEVVGDDGAPVPPGVTGNVLLTQVWNPLMPFVRLRIGDSAAWATRPCRCGSTAPALAHVTGRTFDWVIDAAGRRVAPQRLVLSMHLGVDSLGAVRRYRVRQACDRSIRVEVVAASTWTPALAARLAASYRKLLGALAVEVAEVDELATDPGRKFEVVSSEAGRAR